MSIGRSSHDHDLDLYDRHNPGCRVSSDPQKRLYGQCGCTHCGYVRSRWNDILAPMDVPGRETGKLSSVNICDRCGALVQGIALGAINLVVSSDSMAERLSKELCPGCVGEMVLLLETPLSDAPARAYKEPWKRPEEDKEQSVNDLAL